MINTIKLMGAIWKESLTHPRGYSSFLTTSDGKITVVRHKEPMKISIEDGTVTVIRRNERGVIEIFQVDGIETEAEALVFKESMEFGWNSMLARTYLEPVT